MNKRWWKRAAWRLAADVVQGSREAGWPFDIVDNGNGEYAGIFLEDEEGKTTKDCERLNAALDEIVAAMDIRGGR